MLAVTFYGRMEMWCRIEDQEDLEYLSHLNIKEASHAYNASEMNPILLTVLPLNQTGHPQERKRLALCEIRGLSTSITYGGLIRICELNLSGAQHPVTPVGIAA